MPEKRLRSAQRRKRERYRFWDQHGEKFRLTLIGGTIIVLVVWIAGIALKS